MSIQAINPCDKTENEVCPSRNIYYCDKCYSIHEYKHADIIYPAVRYLYVDRVNEILKSMTQDDIISHRDRYGDNLLQMILKLRTIGLTKQRQQQFLAIDLIKPTDFNEDYMYRGKKNANIIKLYLEILEIICKRCPEFITESMIKYYNSIRAHSIVGVLSNYYEDNNNDMCHVCFSSHAAGLIDNTCLCKNKIHIECLIKTVKCLGHICKTCYHDNGSEYTINSDIIFPFNDIYKNPQADRYCVIDNKYLSLHYAIAYLQSARVTDILISFTKDDYDCYRKNADYVHVHDVDIYGTLILRDELYTGYVRRGNYRLFRNIEILLHDTHGRFYVSEFSLESEADDTEDTEIIDY